MTAFSLSEVMSMALIDLPRVLSAAVDVFGDSR
jgi:hypothetical protein